MFNWSSKKWFFDRPELEAAVGKAKLAMLSKAGSYVRQRMRSILRRRKRVSAPGETPSVHSTDPVATLKNIWFAYDPSSDSVVIGPVAINVFNLLGPGGDGPPVGPPGLQKGVVPRLMEHGGREGVREIQLQDGTWRRVPWRYRTGIRKVPIWRATPEQRNDPNRILSFHREGGRVITYIEIDEARAQRVRWATYASRPFAGPALDLEAPNFPKIWVDSVKKARA